MLADIATRPIRPPMTLLFRAGDEVNSISRGLLDAMGCKYSAHAGQEKERGLEALYSWQSEEVPDSVIRLRSAKNPKAGRSCSGLAYEVRTGGRSQKTTIMADLQKAVFHGVAAAVMNYGYKSTNNLFLAIQVPQYGGQAQFLTIQGLVDLPFGSSLN